VLVVGNYGTGKSHLMSVISALAEYPEATHALKHAGVKKSAKAIAGKFKVLRVEIGSVTSGLRDILLGELESALKRWGTPYKFPPADKITNNKNAIIETIVKFQEKYPDLGSWPRRFSPSTSCALLSILCFPPLFLRLPPLSLWYLWLL
jgi:hypothetical protein